MNFSYLPSPGVINCGHELRKVATKAISAAEIRMDQSGLPSPDLTSFFQAALEATPGYTAPPTLPSGSVAVKAGDTIKLTNSANAPFGAGVVTVTDGVVGVKAPATVALVKAGLSDIAATGTGTKVTFTVAGGKITAITLSE
ncbi:hypothetical protein A2_00440 [Pseudomonas phage BIM BV-45]|nr:hypothetical protein A2_00440 [Pseudomonas phage BIM BV-45]